MGKPEPSLEGVGAYRALAPLEWGTEKRTENLFVLCQVHVRHLDRAGHRLTNFVLKVRFDFFSRNKYQI